MLKAGEEEVQGIVFYSVEAKPETDMQTDTCDWNSILRAGGVV